MGILHVWSTLVKFKWLDKKLLSLLERPAPEAELGKNGIFGCFPFCQTNRSEIGGNTTGKWNNISD